jgi:hypothetical protein
MLSPLLLVRANRCPRTSVPGTKGVTMVANPKFLAATAQVDDAAVKPLPNSRKVYVQG